MKRLIVYQSRSFNQTACKELAPMKYLRVVRSRPQLSGVPEPIIQSAMKASKEYPTNVRIRGYLSTWQSVTPSDRDGDYVLPGAFTQTIPRFMAKNPVLLCDHANQCQMVAGRFEVMREDQRGLYFEAAISNSEAAAHVRVLVVEGMLKATSMSGVFFYSNDGHGITKVELYEGSLVAIPSNPDALFTVI